MIHSLARLAPVLVLAAAGVTAHPAAGALRWEQTEISIQAPVLAESVEATFAFTNAGTSPVTIEDVHSSCGCTVPTLDKRTYAPGESGTIRAVFTLGDRVGLQEKLITLRTAGPEASGTVLTLRVDIPKLFEVSPYFLIWNGSEAAVEKTIDLRLNDPALLSLAKIESRHANFTAEARPDGSQPAHYTIAVKPVSTDTPVNGAILVTLKTPEGKIRTVSLYALVRSASTPRAAPQAAAK